ncbi:hypothetical protein [Bradyrhizobium cenepequi]
MRIAHGLEWVRKRLAANANCSPRTVDYWKSGTVAVGMDEYLSLLQGPAGSRFFEAIWNCVPEATREAWFKAETLRRRLAERDAARAAEDRELQQLRMELNANR